MWGEGIDTRPEVHARNAIADNITLRHQRVRRYLPITNRRASRVTSRVIPTVDGRVRASTCPEGRAADCQIHHPLTAVHLGVTTQCRDERNSQRKPRISDEKINPAGRNFLIRFPAAAFGSSQCIIVTYTSSFDRY